MSAVEGQSTEFAVKSEICFVLFPPSLCLECPPKGLLGSSPPPKVQIGTHPLFPPSPRPQSGGKLKIEGVFFLPASPLIEKSVGGRHGGHVTRRPLCLAVFVLWRAGQERIARKTRNRERERGGGELGQKNEDSKAPPHSEFFFP